VPAAVPKAIQPGVKSALQQVRMAATRDDADRACDRFPAGHQDRHPKATRKLVGDRGELTGCLDFPAGHWQGIRTTSPVESALVTIRHGTRATQGCLNRTTMPCMMSRTGQRAETRWRRLCGYRQLARVIGGVSFRDGIEVQSRQETVAAG